mmetsp:Transcript_5440/g.9476  ORF Transcript_5440/g.9476 Transcript_5440/m.9476 type:complete len:204 (+) Transcript_5440:47-658(+)
MQRLAKPVVVGPVLPLLAHDFEHPVAAKPLHGVYVATEPGVSGVIATIEFARVQHAIACLLHPISAVPFGEVIPPGFHCPRQQDVGLARIPVTSEDVSALFYKFGFLLPREVKTWFDVSALGYKLACTIRQEEVVLSTEGGKAFTAFVSEITKLACNFFFGLLSLTKAVLLDKLVCPVIIVEMLEVTCRVQGGFRGRLLAGSV